jgi:hypothetical protein
MRSFIGVFAGMVGMFGLVACDGFGSSEGPEAPTPPEATPGVDLPPDAPPPLVGSPKVDELTEKYGVFVSTTGSDSGDGTRAHPFATINAGIERVKALKLRVYVCSGVYKESLTLVSGVSVVGALSCDGGTWATGAARTRIDSPASPAIRARDITLATRFEGFDVSVPAGNATSPSSIAFIAERASKLSIVSSKLTAGKAYDGTDGVQVAPLTSGTTLDGTDGLPFVGTFQVPANGTVARRLGQAGGAGSCGGAAGHDGEAGGAGGNGVTLVCKQFITPNLIGYHYEVYVSSFGVSYDRTDAAPRSGANGVAGNDGASATALGALSADGYAPASGTAGADGAPGKGGSGGNGGPSLAGEWCSSSYVGFISYGVAGAGGGAGGCPGLAGTAGTGGGASIAALVLASPGLAFAGSELVAADGGNGGKGAFGTQPTAGGVAGAAKNGGPAGAPGGAGGRAGFSGNGAGGPSAAIAHTGGAPVVEADTKVTAGAGGKGVIERTDNGVVIPASTDGSAKALLAF